MRNLALMLVGFGLGCADTAVDPEGREAQSDIEIDEDDTDVPCESGEGELSGRILRAFGADETPAPNAQLKATPEGDEQPIVILADGQGRFSTSIPADAYDVIAEESSCFSESKRIELNACDNIVETFRLVDCFDG